MTEPSMRTAALACLLAALLLGGCDGSTPSGVPSDGSHGAATREPAELEVGDMRIRASLVPTLSISEAMAGHYGIERHRRSALLLVGVRQGPEHAETSLPARVSVVARDLRGVPQSLEMREVRSEGFIDYVGIARVTPPDTLSFEVLVERDDAAAATLRFNRDVFPH